MHCELCGAEVPRTKIVTIEGTTLSVCPNCAKFGDQTSVPLKKQPGVPAEILRRLEARKKRMTVRDVYSREGEETLVDDYSERIRKAREKKGWKQVELGTKVNERVSIIARLESGEMIPTDAVVKKLEKALEIKLREKVEAVAAMKSSVESKPLTLGDLIRVEKE
jgi:putative transcription factor